MQRRNDIDWLRVFATYLLFVFHTAMIFNPAPFYHIRNGQVSTVMLVFAGFISLWHMPLFFVLAGWSVHGSLRSRGGAAGFARERLLKLGVPLVAGCITIGPVLKFIELKSGLDLSHAGLRVAPYLQESFRSVIPNGLPMAPPFHETFFEFLPTFFTRLDRFSWAHLWFVAYLLTFSLLYLPLFRALTRSAGLQPDAAIPREYPPWSALWVYAPLLPLAVIQVALRPSWPGVQNLYDDWANFAYYSTFLILGFTLAWAPAFEAAVHREAKRALGMSLLAMAALLGAVLRLYDSQALLLAGSAVAGWLFIVAGLGFANSYLQRETSRLEYLRESAFPVYILHQPAIVLVGYAVVATSLGIATKFIVIMVTAFAVTLTFYHFAVRRSPLLRVIYGMKPRATCRVRVVARAGAAATLLLATLLGTVASASSTAPVGLWWAEGGAAQVEIHNCDDGLCGRVAWLRSPFGEDGCELRDEHNPDPSNRARPVLGLEIMEGLQPAGAHGSEWIGGTIYDPGTGNTYRCRMNVEDENTLLLRGYIGIPLLGRTTKWFRVDSRLGRCRR